MNHRELFGLAKGASIKEVKDKWREEANKLHPDKNPNSSLTDFYQARSLYEDALKEARKPVKCEECKGSGKVTITKGFYSLTKRCSTCKGRGTKD